MKHYKFPVPSKRTLTFTWVIFALVLIALVVWGVVTLTGQNREIDKLKSAETSAVVERGELRGDLDKQGAAFDEANKKLVDAGEVPVIPPVVESEDNDGPSQGQLLVAVQQFCVANNMCRGPAGPAAPPAEDGEDGASVKGDKGDPGETIKGDKGDKGDPGSGGTDGTDGAPGRGIVTGPTCNEDGTWTTTFTDGTSDTQPGPCRVSLLQMP